MGLDAHGRPTTKVCPDCSRELGRTAQVCPDCGHAFIGKHNPLRKTAVATPAVGEASSDADDFDCIKLANGGLRLQLPTGDVILTSRQRQIVAIELGAPAT